MLTTQGRQRFDELDSLRGFAAMVVVFGHAAMFWNKPYPEWRLLFNQSPFGLLASGPDAVYVFFLLSGFVLFLPYLRPEGPGPYSSYLLRRTCRIYLPYLAALGLAILADIYFYRPSAQAMFPDWNNWHRPIPVIAVWQHLLFIWRPSLSEFNPNFWTLAQEMRLSILYPVVAYFALRLNLIRGYLVCVLICFLGFFFADYLNVYDLRTVGYGGLFVMGALVARYLKQIRIYMEARGWVGSALMLVAAIFFFKCTHLLPEKYYQFWAIVPLHGTGALLILVSALTSQSFRSFLHLEPLRWLGKVSYSIYLLHGVVLYSLASLFWTRTDHHIALMLGGIAFSLPLAAVFYRWVEVPSIALGRHMTQKRPLPVETQS